MSGEGLTLLGDELLERRRLFIALPVLRVLVMLGAFIVNRDYRLGLVATVVLITILAGLVIGLSLASSPAY